MRAPYIVLLLVAVAISACGSASSEDNARSVNGAQQLGTNANQGAQPAGDSSGPTGTEKSPAAAKPPSPSALYPAAVDVKTRSGKGIGVVLLPDTGDKRRATAEAKKLAALGVTAVVVEGPADAPTERAAFEQAVSSAQLAIATLRKRDGIDPNRVGLIGEGVGAHVGAVAMGRQPRAVAAAVLADIGGIVVPSPTFAPERWLRRAIGSDVLFQRDTATRAMTSAEIKRLMLAAPPGTLMEQYKKLDGEAEMERDTWMRDHLIAR